MADNETIRLPEKARAKAEGRLRLLVLGEAGFSAHALPAEGSVSIGRSDEVDVRVDDPAMSRKHAVFHVKDGVRLEDKGSANGSWVGERKLAPNETVDLRVGEVIELG